MEVSLVPAHPVLAGTTLTLTKVPRPNPSKVKAMVSPLATLVGETLVIVGAAMVTSCPV